MSNITHWFIPILSNPHIKDLSMLPSVTPQVANIFEDPPDPPGPFIDPTLPVELQNLIIPYKDLKKIIKLFRQIFPEILVSSWKIEANSKTGAPLSEIDVTISLSKSLILSNPVEHDDYQIVLRIWDFTFIEAYFMNMALPFASRLLNTMVLQIKVWSDIQGWAFLIRNKWDQIKKRDVIVSPLTV